MYCSINCIVQSRATAYLGNWPKLVMRVQRSPPGGTQRTDSPRVIASIVPRPHTVLWYHISGQARKQLGWLKRCDLNGSVSLLLSAPAARCSIHCPIQFPTHRPSQAALQPSSKARHRQRPARDKPRANAQHETSLSAPTHPRT